LFELVEAALDDVALLVGGPVEAGRAAAVGAFGGPPGDLVGALGDRVADPAAAQRRPGGVVRISLVGQQQVRALAGTAGPAAVDGDGVQGGQQVGVVTGLPRADQYRQWPAAPVNGQVDLGRQAAPGPAERFPGGYRDGRRPPR
jgi:hypothetical protein